MGSRETHREREREGEERKSGREEGREGSADLLFSNPATKKTTITQASGPQFNIRTSFASVCNITASGLIKRSKSGS